MKLLVTTHAQMFISPDGRIWTKNVYSYQFFQRYLEVFDNVKLVSRAKNIASDQTTHLIEVSGPRLEICPMPFWHGPLQYLKVRSKVKRLFHLAINGCDCAILRIPDQFSFELYKYLKKKKIPCGVEVVAHPWDLYSLKKLWSSFCLMIKNPLNFILRQFIRILWDNLQKKTCRTADCVAYVTEEFLQKRYSPYYHNITNTKRYITNYTSADLEAKDFYRKRELLDFNHTPITLLHVSGINNLSKGHNELINALYEIKINKLADVKMIFVGGGTYLEFFKKKVLEKGLGNLVIFTGNISSKEELSNYYREADIFVFPSETEGLPRVMIEAMAMGLPIIASDVGGIAELICKESLLKEISQISIKKKIIQFALNPELLAEESKKNFYKSSKYAHENIQEKRNAMYSFLRKLATEHGSNKDVLRF